MNNKSDIILNINRNPSNVITKYKLSLKSITDSHLNVINIGDKIIMSGRNGQVIYGYYLGLRKSQYVYLYFTSFGYIGVSYTPYIPYKAEWESNIITDIHKHINDYLSQIKNNLDNITLVFC